MKEKQFSLPTLNFRCELKLPEAQKDRMLNVYGVKFSSLMKNCFSVRLSPVDYADLPHIREWVKNKPTAEEVCEIVFKCASDYSFNLFLSCSPIYNHCPNDLKAFILLTIGVKSKDLSND
jgi:hypothetical protein